MKIYVSGLYSGPNPSPGVGIARSLRAAYPHARLVGVDYSPRSTGLHWTDFDEIWLQQPWDELDLDEYRRQICDVLDSGAFWIPGLDLEIRWLARSIGAHAHLLGASLAALGKTAKPAVPALAGLEVAVPSFIATTRPDQELHAFCRRHGWRVWLKGPYYEALRVQSWGQFVQARDRLARTWATNALFLQAHVAGREESIALSAFRGRLLGAISMTKREVTPEGKTWAARVESVPADTMRRLGEIVAELDWTGGAELEMTRDAACDPWLIEWNPRFPAWIHGGTIAGHNLPGLLIQAATGSPLADAHVGAGSEFVRVVVEIPTRPRFPLPPAQEQDDEAFGHAGKHPSGMPVLADLLRRGYEPVTRIGVASGGSADEPDEQTESLRSIIADLATYDLAEVQTPCRLYLGATSRGAFAAVGGLARRVSTYGIDASVAYSIKTNPDDRYLELARESGMLAEAISQLEIGRALSRGFDGDSLILNGPGKWWPERDAPLPSLFAVFADSVDDFRRLAAQTHDGFPAPRIMGARLCPPGVPSRFGIQVGVLDQFHQLVSLVATLPGEQAFGVHFHMASSAIGTERWWRLFESVVKWSEAIETLSGKRVECLDLGGGWFPDDLGEEYEDRLGAALRQMRRRLPDLGHVVLEPGKALAQPCMALATRVLSARHADGHVTDVVVDGSIAELPDIQSYPHRILLREADTSNWRPLRHGAGRILGRLCMEHDVLAMHVELPDSLQERDVLVVCDAGAYDRSMSYVFGQ